MITRIALVTWLCLATPAFGLIIDDFSVGDVAVTVDADNPNAHAIQSGLDVGATIGGVRKIGLSFTEHEPGYVGSATVDTTTQTLRIEADGDGFESYVVSWGDILDPNTALNANLLADGADSFRIDVMSSIRYTGFGLVLRSAFDEGLDVRISRSVKLSASDSPYSVRVPFTVFPDVDFEDIDIISIHGFGGPFDLTLGGIRTVPEPSTLVSLAIGLIGIMWRGRR